MFTVYRVYTATGYTEFRDEAAAAALANGTLQIESIERADPKSENDETGGGG